LPPATAGVFLFTNVYVPLSLTSTIFDVSYNPTVVLTAPPFFSAALSFYSISAAFLIAVLVVANVGKTRELGELCRLARKASTYVVLPIVGIVFGASCCLSIAGLVLSEWGHALTLIAPGTPGLTSALVFYTTYFVFPWVAVLLLYLNLRSVEKISASIKQS